jgi:CRP-like cAMP-binding protein
MVNAELLTALKVERRGDLLDGLNESQLERLASLGRPAKFDADATIFREGDLHDRVYLILQGRVRLEMNVPGRGRMPILSLGGGDLLAFSPLVGAEAMTATAVATEPTESLRFDAAEIRDLCERDHEFGFLLMRELSVALARRLIATRLQLLDLFRRPDQRHPALPADHSVSP